MFQFSENIYADVLGPNFFDPKLIRATAVQRAAKTLIVPKGELLWTIWT